MSKELLLKDCIENVKTFHEAFLIGNEEEPKAEIPENDYLLRYKLMREENEEYLEAAQNGDLVEIADALADQLYILLGTMHVHGMADKMEEIFDEVHRSNMSKLDEYGNPIYRADGKILKGSDFSEPNIASIIND